MGIWKQSEPHKTSAKFEKYGAENCFLLCCNAGGRNSNHNAHKVVKSTDVASVGQDGEEREFKHPVLQCWGLSAGEAACILLFLTDNFLKQRRRREKETAFDQQGLHLHCPHPHYCLLL